MLLRTSLDGAAGERGRELALILAPTKQRALGSGLAVEGVAGFAQRLKTRPVATREPSKRAGTETLFGVERPLTLALEPQQQHRRVVAIPHARGRISQPDAPGSSALRPFALVMSAAPAPPEPGRWPSATVRQRRAFPFGLMRAERVELMP